MEGCYKRFIHRAKSFDYVADIQKIAKGKKDHTCYHCKEWVKKRKIKMLVCENYHFKQFFSCFRCWGKLNEMGLLLR